jgi:hypothetical protein
VERRESVLERSVVDLAGHDGLRRVVVAVAVAAGEVG